MGRLLTMVDRTQGEAKASTINRYPLRTCSVVAAAVLGTLQASGCSYAPATHSWANLGPRNPRAAYVLGQPNPAFWGHLWGTLQGARLVLKGVR